MTREPVPSLSTTPGRELVLADRDAQATAELAGELARRYRTVEDPDFLHDLPLLAAELPIATRRHLRSFAWAEEWGYCVINNHHLDDARLGPTPAHWRGRVPPKPELPEEILLLLYAAILGEPFG